MRAIPPIHLDKQLDFQRNRKRDRDYLMTWSVVDNPSGTRKHEKANMQYARKSLLVATEQVNSGTVQDRVELTSIG